MGDVERLKNEAADRFGIDSRSVRMVSAPYRICPLGAHIDHQLGPVTAMALDQGVLLAYAPTTDGQVRLASLDFPGEVEFNLRDVPDKIDDDWGNFPRGAGRALQENHSLNTGMQGVVAGKLHGGGVSSSAAVGVAFLLAFEDVNGLQVSAEENIQLDQEIENGYLGLRIGILDQSAILLSRRDQLTLIDCKSLEHELIAPPANMPKFDVLLAFSGLRKALVGTDYNRRVDECAQAATTLLQAVGRPDARPVLGHITAEEYQAHKNTLNGPAARRAAHFFSEVDRVRRGVEVWKSGDLHAFGKLMTASGESSIVNYECGSPPLVDLYQTLIAAPGVHGARFSGAGFRGCCAALVDPAASKDVADSASASYHRLHPDLAEDADVVILGTADGARLL
ncbi:MAG: hypothetical protein N2C14_20100 [Planctomycetales bacterium]